MSKELLIQKGKEMLLETGAKALLLYVESDSDLGLAPENTIFVYDNKKFSEIDDTGVLIPLNVSPEERMNLAIAGAMEKGLLHKNDKVIYVNNNSISLKTAKEQMDKGIYKILFTAANIDPDVVKEVLEIAVELGKKGREGKPVGSTFIIGDSGEVMNRSTQITYNPFQGSMVNIQDDVVRSMIKEYSRLDGAFIISGKGKIIAAARFLECGKEGIKMPKGLGARHMAAAWITKKTDSIGVVLSESDNMIRVFWDGEMIEELDPEKL
ncbi:MAG: DNA integrity scanning protein DisA nucleotide-binding domain protein [Theionarchaea archaeon]|nr:DNA integrity scanning protein DisA nucleotide-binding domain protein [Theionarchaea archaeon]MBU7038279.1 DNA integrity scanning protein DisA nucleotide-binding domain protein [Theionarchaea archaeon]